MALSTIITAPHDVGHLGKIKKEVPVLEKKVFLTRYFCNENPPNKTH
jgi:hypothetical protein